MLREGTYVPVGDEGKTPEAKRSFVGKLASLNRI